MKSKKENEKMPEGPYNPWAPGIKKPALPDYFIIEVIGCLTEDWSEWFNGLNIYCSEERGISYLQGPVKDQAELYSILLKIRKLGLSLLRVHGES